MATPMSAVQFVDLLKKWGIPYGTINANWATHNRNHKGAWGPVNGVMMHHTGSDEQTGMRNYLYNGSTALPGPLCHGGIDNAGKVWLTGWGRCNHAGLGDSQTLSAVIAESYGNTIKPNSADVDGNARFYGFEIMYSGSHAMTAKQRETSEKVAAAICTYHKWSAKSVIAHGEWQPGKWDPGYAPGKLMDMYKLRNEIGAYLKSGPTKPTPPSPPTNAYTIVAGDTLSDIAKRFLGDSKRWPELVNANQSKLIKVTPGTKITIPKK